MKNIIPFKTKNNKYLYIFSKKQFILIDDAIYKIFISFTEGKISKKEINKIAPNKWSYSFINTILSEYKYDLKPKIFTNISPVNIKEEFFINPIIVFEVTEKCNLNCEYCSYGNLYNTYDKRTNKKFNINNAMLLIKYITSNPLFNYSKEITISFYGGEPLLEFNFIKEIVLFCKKEIKNVKIIFSMTTNGLLLNKYSSFLIKNNFEISISIDGNKENHSYRKFKNGENSFSNVFQNIKLIQNKYPLFFKNNILLLTVLHNKNSVKEVRTFLFKEFGKFPNISELADNGILPNKKKIFSKMFKNEYEDILNKKSFYKKLLTEQIEATPDFYSLTLFISNLTNQKTNEIENIYTLKEELNSYIPTSTCIPFNRKIFITCNNKILVCESIDHKYSVGKIVSNEIQIDFEKIAQIHNNYLNNIIIQCQNCYKISSCENCIYTMRTNSDNKPICDEFLNYKNFKEYLSNKILFLETNKHAIKKIIYETEIE